MLGCCTDRHTRALQALASLQPRLSVMGLLYVQQLSGKGGKAPTDQSLLPPSPAGSIAGSASSSTGSSPEVSSHRLPDLVGRRRRRSSNGRRSGGSSSSAGTAQRGSMDAARGKGAQQRQALRRLEFQPKPRMSADSDAVVALTPRGSQEGAASVRRRRGASDHPAAPLPDEAGAGSAASDSDSSPASHSSQRSSTSRRRQWQPRMQRISSGQQLSESSAAPSFFPAPSAQPPSAQLPSTEPSADPAATAATSGSAASRWLPTSSVSWAALSAADRLPSAEWVASCSAWAASTVDTLLKPLAPAVSLAVGSLQRVQSAPMALPSQAPPAAAALPGSDADLHQQQQEPARRESLDQDQMRRRSLDGASVRHYTRGGISAHPDRADALIALAGAARRQGHAASLGGAASVAAAGFLDCSAAPAAPVDGPAAVEAAPVLAGPAAAPASSLASLGLDGDCPTSIRDQVTDEHLLQFGALIGEGASRAALEQLRIPGAWGEAGSLLGMPDTPACCEEGWEQVGGWVGGWRGGGGCGVLAC